MGTCSPVDFVTCTIEMCFAPETIEEALGVLRSTVGRTEAKPGCRHCVVARDVVEPDRVRYSVAWNSKAGFQRHLRGEEFRVVMLAMDMSREEPRVVLGDLTGCSGLACLQELRDAASPG
jgi:quinol monooxygenase YgiN